MNNFDKDISELLQTTEDDATKTMVDIKAEFDRLGIPIDKQFRINFQREIEKK